MVTCETDVNLKWVLFTVMEKCPTVIYANEKQSRASDTSIRVIALVSGWRRQTNITAQLEFFIKEMTRSCGENHLFTSLGWFGEQQMNIMQQPILRFQDSDIRNTKANPHAVHHDSPKGRFSFSSKPD